MVFPWHEGICSLFLITLITINHSVEFKCWVSDRHHHLAARVRGAFGGGVIKDIGLLDTFVAALPFGQTGSDDRLWNSKAEGLAGHSKRKLYYGFCRLLQPICSFFGLLSAGRRLWFLFFFYFSKFKYRNIKRMDRKVSSSKALSRL